MFETYCRIKPMVLDMGPKFRRFLACVLARRWGHPLGWVLPSTSQWELDVCLLGTGPQLEEDAIGGSLVLGHNISM